MKPRPGDIVTKEPRKFPTMNLRLWSSCLFRSVDPASLVYFRIAFYGIMVWEVWRVHRPRLGRAVLHWKGVLFHILALRFCTAVAG